MIHSAQDAGRSHGHLHFVRGNVLDKHGKIGAALCDLQIATLNGVEAAEDAVLDVERKVAAAQRDNFTAIDTLKDSFIAWRSHEGSAHANLRTLLEEWRFEHVHHSTAIEGNTMPYQFVRAFLETRLPPSTDFHIDTLNEVLGTDMAYRFVVESSGFMLSNATDYWADGKYTAPDVSARLILDIHKHVLFDKPHAAGMWRPMAVRVSDHVAPAPDAVPRLMDSLLNHWRSPAFLALHPVEQAALAHFEFVWVHPFEDGNGRTARFLSSYFLLRAGFPPLNLHLGDRDAYFAALKQSHPRKGGCTRQLVQVMYERVSALTRELVKSIGLSPQGQPLGADHHDVSGVQVDASSSSDRASPSNQILVPIASPTEIIARGEDEHSEL